MILRHVRREANQVADFLANWGVQELREKMDSLWMTHSKDPRFEQLRKILIQDHHENTT